MLPIKIYNLCGLSFYYLVRLQRIQRVATLFSYGSGKDHRTNPTTQAQKYSQRKDTILFINILCLYILSGPNPVQTGVKQKFTCIQTSESKLTELYLLSATARPASPQSIILNRGSMPRKRTGRK